MGQLSLFVSPIFCNTPMRQRRKLAAEKLPQKNA
jgi:hypothetical protein